MHSPTILFLDFDCESCKLSSIEDDCYRETGNSIEPNRFFNEDFSYSTIRRSDEDTCLTERRHEATGLNVEMIRLLKHIVRSSLNIYKRRLATIWIALRPFSHGIHVELISTVQPEESTSGNGNEKISAEDDNCNAKSSVVKKIPLLREDVGEAATTFNEEDDYSVLKCKSVEKKINFDDYDVGVNCSDEDCVNDNDDVFAKECRKFLMSLQNFSRKEITRDDRGITIDPRIASILLLDVNACRFGRMSDLDDNNEAYHRITYVSGETLYTAREVVNVLFRRKRAIERECEKKVFRWPGFANVSSMSPINLKCFRRNASNVECEKKNIAKRNRRESKNTLKGGGRGRGGRGGRGGGCEVTYAWKINLRCHPKTTTRGNFVNLFFCRNKKPLIKFNRSRVTKESFRIPTSGGISSEFSDNDRKSVRGSADGCKSLLIEKNTELAGKKKNVICAFKERCSVRNSSTFARTRPRKFLMFERFIRIYLCKREPFATRYFLHIFKNSLSKRIVGRGQRPPSRLASFFVSLILRDEHAYLVRRIIERLTEWLDSKEFVPLPLYRIARSVSRELRKNKLFSTSLKFTK